MEISEEKLYEKVLDAAHERFEGNFHEFLGISKKEYRDTVHCKYCKKPKWKRKYCEAPHPYGCIINVVPMWEEEERRNKFNG